MNKYSASVFVSIVSFAVYLTTMCPTVDVTDAGELATAAATLSIAHPTGYPLFTLLGRCAVMIPLGAEEISRLNILAAVETAVAAGVFLLLAMSFIDASKTFPARKRNLLNESEKLLVGISTSLTFAFCATVWLQSTSVEVYSLHILLLVLTCLFFIKGVEEQMSTDSSTSRFLFFFAFILGLSFTNHMTTILLAPAFLYLYFSSFGFRRESFIRLVKLAPTFCLGLSLYFYLLIRSSSRPPLDWGHPSTFERLIWHVSGKQYQVWMFEGWSLAQKQITDFFRNLPSEFQWVILIILLIGMFQVATSSKKLFVFLVLLAITSVGYAANYQIHDIKPYFLLAYLALACFIGYGIQSVVSLFAGNRFKRFVIVGLMLLLPIAQFLNNRKSADSSQNTLARDVCLDVLNNVEQNSVVITTLWDYLVSPAYYYQIVKGIRRDVTIIDKSLLQNRPWYFLQLEKSSSWLSERSRERLISFLSELGKFERDEPFNYQVMMAAWSNLLNDIVRNSLKDRFVYVDGRVDGEFSPAYKKIPSGFFYRMVQPGDSSNFRPIEVSTALGDNTTPVFVDFRQYYAFMLTKTAQHQINGNKISEAKKTLERVLKMEPGYPAAVYLRNQLMH
ncbi:MAG: DUF2723 domain-containing protein [Bacteroidetes bacterium]|nr:DUF2723 domain-containing protein [Bacteroidota bacterium]